MTPFTFSYFKTAVQRQFKRLLEAGPIFTTNIDKDRIWSVYMGAFQPGTNPLYRKQTEHDCSCCRHFLRAAGGIVGIINNEVVSLWDLSYTDLDRYQPVANALAAFAKSFPIQNVFLHPEAAVGVDRNRGLFGEEVVNFDHFHLSLPAEMVVREGPTRGSRLAAMQATHDVLLRGLREITPDALTAVQELIAQGSLYRGAEHAYAVGAFCKLKTEFEAVGAESFAQDLFAWAHTPKTPPAIARIRNTSIGTLLTDLSTGVDLDTAVKSFEKMVAPANYKRPTALVTKGMIEKARAELDVLGLLPSLERRYAVLEDIKIPDVLFADRAARKRMRDVFDSIVPAPPKGRALDKVEEIGIEDFVANVLPGATSLEVMFENRHAGNLVSLIAPYDLTAKGLFKWSNPFSWSYQGDLADSIKERVKSAGGMVDVDLRCSLAWSNHDDLDLHMREPGGEHIFFAHKTSASGGALDVDMNAGMGRTREPVENIRYPSRRTMHEGIYQLAVNQYCQRESIDFGFEVEIEFDGGVHTFTYPNAMRTGQTVDVAEIEYSQDDGFKIVKSIAPAAPASKALWNLATQQFHRVQLVTLSPNYWEGHGVGNKHYFFMLDGCKNDGQARGFYNEFLSSELDKHRKVMEMVGAKMRTEKADGQLSGLGFSSTQRNSLLCKVQGAFTRTVKIVF